MKSFHKRLFLVVIVVLPMWWLIFTADGKRRSDTLILWMMGGNPIDINFTALDQNYTREDWQKVFHDIDWQCQKQESAFGTELCYSEVSSYNGIPARYVSAFFHEERITAVKLVYRNQYHQQMGEDLYRQLGAPLNKTHESSENDVLQWHTEHGSVMIKTELTPDEEATLIWISK